jgi:hypothetical protein
MSPVRSGRILVDAAGKEEHVMLDPKDAKSIERAQGYDLKPGARFNALQRLSQKDRDFVLSQSTAEQDRILALSDQGRADLFAAIAGAKVEKPAYPATPAPKATEGSKS